MKNKVIAKTVNGLNYNDRTMNTVTNVLKKIQF